MIIFFLLTICAFNYLLIQIIANQKLNCMDDQRNIFELLPKKSYLIMMMIDEIQRMNKRRIDKVLD